MSLSAHRPTRPGPARTARAGTGIVAGLGLLVACATAPPASTAAAALSSHRIQVVAAENCWGSIAAQLGGSKVTVRSIIHSPDADPHDYEPTAADGRAIATADLTLVNGIGYDSWATKLAAASPDSRRVDLTVGDVVGVPPEGNPHRWYDPQDVTRVVDAVTAGYVRLDPADAAYFARRKAAFETTGLKQYDGLLTPIRATYAGTPVGASESIFALLGAHLWIRGRDVVRLGLDGDRWGFPLPGASRWSASARGAGERVDEVIELVGAGDYAGRPIGELSGGEQQRLLIAQALASRPRLLLLDEPLDSLDLPNQAAVAALVARICRYERVCVLMVVHDVNPILPHVDQVAALNRGSLVAGTVTGLVTTERLSALFSTPVEVITTSSGQPWW